MMFTECVTSLENSALHLPPVKRTAAKISATPFLRRLQDRGLNQAQFAREHGYTPADLTNWKVRGLPRGELPKIAAWCKISVDAYLAEAGGVPHPKEPGQQTTLEAAALLNDYDALPEGLKEIVARKAHGLREYVDSLPTFLREALKNAPSDPEQYRRWEREIEAALVAHHPARETRVYAVDESKTIPPRRRRS